MRNSINYSGFVDLIVDVNDERLFGSIEGSVTQMEPQNETPLKEPVCNTNDRTLYD